MWIKPETMEVARTHSEARNIIREVCLPMALTDEMLEAHGLMPVMLVAAVYDPATQTATELAPALVEGVWTQQWEVTALPEEQVTTIYQQAITSKWEAIKAERDKRKAGGVKVVVDGADKWFHSDDPSRIQHIGLVMMGVNIPPNLQWKTMDGTFVTMTQTLANQIFQAVSIADQTIFAKAEQLKAEMEALTDPSTFVVEQDGAKTKWPLIYGE